MQKLHLFLLLCHTTYVCTMEYALNIPRDATPKQALEICIKEAQTNDFWKNVFIKAPTNAPLNQTMSPMPHNAYASKDMGYKYHQQTQNMEQQFASGAAGAMLDFHTNTQEQKANPSTPPKFMLAHTDSPSDKMTIEIGPFHIKYGTARPVLEALQKETKLLKKNQKRPFFINIEDDIKGDNVAYEKRLNTLITESGLTDIIVSPQDLHNFFKNNPHKTFPSLKDLGKHLFFIADDTRSG